jgi:hypothetical protein
LQIRALLRADFGWSLFATAAPIAGLLAAIGAVRWATPWIVGRSGDGAGR